MCCIAGACGQGCLKLETSACVSQDLYLTYLVVIDGNICIWSPQNVWSYNPGGIGDRLLRARKGCFSQNIHANTLIFIGIRRTTFGPPRGELSSLLSVPHGYGGPRSVERKGLRLTQKTDVSVPLSQTRA